MKPDQRKINAAGLAVIIKNGNVLLIKRSKKYKYEPGKYTLPSGKRESNETILQTTFRETLEETGIKINLKFTKFAHAMSRKESEEDEWLDFFFVIKKWTGEPKIMEPEKCEGIKWAPVDHLPKNTISFVKVALKNISKKIKYSEFGYSHKK